MFDQEPFPGNPKILFIGNPTSSHVQGWINLLSETNFNVRLFACADGYPPADWKVKTYIITKYPPEKLDLEWRESWWPEPEKWYEFNDKVKIAMENEQARNAKIVEHNVWLQEINHITENYVRAAIGFEFKYQTLIFEYNNLILKVDSIRFLCGRISHWIKQYFLPRDSPARNISQTMGGNPYSLFFPGFPHLETYPAEPQILTSMFPIQEPQSKTPSPQEWLAEVIKILAA